MKILLTGANGFIGRYMASALFNAGHDVIPAVRDTEQTDRMLGRPCSIRVDFNRDKNIEDWLPRLSGVDVVINCAGILKARKGQSIEAIHVAGPIALFEAARQAGVKRIIHISAISAEPGAGTDYARTKHRADEYLKAMPGDWVILRPSLVYTIGAFGGTSLLRAMSALPFFIPMPGKGDQLFQPIHMDDLARILLHCLDSPDVSRKVLDPVGPRPVALRDILVSYRRWLGFAPAPLVPIPMGLIRAAARVGDFFHGPFNSTSLKQLLYGNTASVSPLLAATGITPMSWNEGLRRNPAQVQDRWHARLFFLRSAILLVLAFLWLASAALGVHALNGPWTDQLMQSGLSRMAANGLIGAGSVIDLALGIALLRRASPDLLAIAQLGVIAIYTMALSIIAPDLWLDPLGPLLKNIPIALLIPVYWAIAKDR